jgi:hypothetical protein
VKEDKEYIGTQFHSALAQIGNSWHISEDLFLQMEAFTCLLYGGKEVYCVNIICAIIRSEESAVQRVKRLMPQKILI